MCFLVLGISFFPIVSKVFKKYNDKGWIFSKVIALGITGLSLFIITYCKILKFNSFSCYLVLIIWLIINIGICMYKKDDYRAILQNKNIWRNIFISEIIFCVVFIAWTYIKSFNVQITNATEQFMNYGFMNKIMKSEYMPPEDIWFSGHNINYYYFGQYISAFIAKISGLNVNEGYNIVLALIACFSFVLPYSISLNIAKFIKSNNKIVKYIIAIFTGVSICIGGTLYYPIYKNVVKENNEPYYYWDATRYIGYRPDTNDKTITDIPAYSNVVGDLHAHYIDTIFVFVTLSLLLALLFNKEDDNTKKSFCNFNVLLLGVFLGIQKMTNYWDFPIYTVVIMLFIFVNSIFKYKFNKKSIFRAICQMFVIMLTCELVTIPFSRDLYISATQVKFTNVRSPFYKMLVLWGLPCICYIVFVFSIIKNLIVNKKKDFINKIKNISLSDIYIMIIGICALGLVILPELIYLKDIYSDEFKRANTMFKLTYQAYILFSISTCYILLKFICKKTTIVKKLLAVIVTCIYITTFGYGINAIEFNMKNAQFCNMNNSENFIKISCPDDYEAIQWIKSNVNSSDVIVEFPGNSYTTSSRISVFTGNPTVLGWYAHEWIWRAENYQPPKEQFERYRDVKDLYSCNDSETIKEIIKKYNISYVYIGNIEYSQTSNLDLLLNIGTVVYENSNNSSKTPVYIIKT